MVISAQVAMRIARTMNRKPNTKYICKNQFRGRGMRASGKGAMGNRIVSQCAVCASIVLSCPTWWSQRADIIKKSSIQTAPKGSTPPRATLKTGCVYQTCARGVIRGEGNAVDPPYGRPTHPPSTVTAHLIGDVSCDLVGPHGHGQRILLEAEVTADEHERRADPKPQQNQRQECGNRRVVRGPVVHHKAVDAQEDDSHESWIERGSEQCVSFPFFAVEEFVDSRGRIAGEGPHEYEEEQQSGE